MEYIFGTGLAIIILLLTILIFRKQGVSAVALSEIENLRQAVVKEENKVQELQNELNFERTKFAKAEANLQHQQERFAEQEIYIADLNKKLSLEFQNIANKLLEEKAQKFTEQNRSNLDIILNPFKEKLKDFEDKVDKVYKAENDERNVLKGVIMELKGLNQQISDEAKNLTKALKGDSKKQGNWGEVILERVLERSGLVRDREYRLQAAMQNADGSRFYPDAIIDLPDEKHLIIDSKVSLLAYDRLVNADSDAERDLHVKDHLLSIRKHISDLSMKNYADLHKVNSPDFVLLFIPIESGMAVAVEKDAELFNYAWDKRIVIVSPSTLLATLRTIASIWKQERQNQNVFEIARLSGEMYDKFVGFVTDMESIGKNIRQSGDAYEKALNKLSSGRGNLTITAEKIKRLGAKAGKQIDQKFLSDEE